MLFPNVFANQNLRRSISSSAAALYSLHWRHSDEKPVSTTLLIPVTYKCPLPQPFSFDILTNAPGVWGVNISIPKVLLELLLLPTRSFAQKVHLQIACFLCVAHSSKFRILYLPLF